MPATATAPALSPRRRALLAAALVGRLVGTYFHVGYFDQMSLLPCLLGLFLLAGLLTRWVAGAALVLLVVLIAGIAQSWARGLSIDCGCFGGGGQVAEWLEVEE